MLMVMDVKAFLHLPLSLVLYRRPPYIFEGIPETEKLIPAFTDNKKNQKLNRK
jgi:hypothetical protein